MAERPRLRHPRRGEGDRQAGPAPPRRSSDPRSSSRAPRSTACSTASSPPCPCRADRRRRDEPRPHPPARRSRPPIARRSSCWLRPGRRAAGRVLVAVNGALLAGRRCVDVAAGRRPVAASRWPGPCRRSSSCGTSGELDVDGSQPDRSRGVRVALADELAPVARGPRTPPAPRRASPAGRHAAQHGRRCTPTPTGPVRDPRRLVVRVDGPARARRPPAPPCDRPALLRVHPAFPSREEAELRINRARILEVGLRSAKGRGGGTEFDQLREYGVDDEVRRIDWAATARAGKADGAHLPSRAEPERAPPARQRAGDGGPGRRTCPASSTPWTRVMCLTTVATRLGDRCGLVAFDRAVRAVLPGRSGRDQLGRVAEAMFDLEPVLAESDYRGAFTQALARFRRRSLIVLFTDLVEQAVGESLLPALPAARAPPRRARRGGARPRRRRAGPTQPPGGAGRRLPRRRRRDGARRARPRHRPPARPRAPSSSTPHPASSPPASPTPTSTSRPGAGCRATRGVGASVEHCGRPLATAPGDCPDTRDGSYHTVAVGALADRDEASPALARPDGLRLQGGGRVLARCFSRRSCSPKAPV